jgi:hypothetical protein
MPIDIETFESSPPERLEGSGLQLDVKTEIFEVSELLGNPEIEIVHHLERTARRDPNDLVEPAVLGSRDLRGEQSSRSAEPDSRCQRALDELAPAEISLCEGFDELLEFAVPHGRAPFECCGPRASVRHPLVDVRVRFLASYPPLDGVTSSSSPTSDSSSTRSRTGRCPTPRR